MRIFDQRISIRILKKIVHKLSNCLLLYFPNASDFFYEEVIRLLEAVPYPWTYDVNCTYRRRRSEDVHLLQFTSCSQSILSYILQKT